MELDVFNCTPTKRSLKRQRCCISSALSPKIKQKPEPLISHNKWNEEEKAALVLMVEEAEGQENINWKECASRINSMFNGNRTSKSCQSFYARNSTQKLPNISKVCDAAVQTDITLSPRDNFIFVKQNQCDEANSRSSPNCSSSSTGEFSSENSILRHLLLGDSFQPIATSTPQKEHNTVATCTPKKKDNTTDGQCSEEISKKKPNIDHNYSRKVENSPVNNKRISAEKNRLKKHANVVSRLETCSIFSSGHLISTKECLSLKLLLERTRRSNIISRKIMSIPSLKRCIVDVLCESVGKRPDEMRNKKHGFVSVLMSKDFNSLKNIKFEDVIGELQEKFPEVLQLIMSMMLSKKNQECAEKKAAIIPRLAMIYCIIMQSRHHEFSRLQRINAMCLADNISDQAVYDRLNRLGVSSPYCVTLKIFNEIGKMYPKLLVESLQEGKYLRFVGDNLNFSVGTSHETMNNHKHMVHMFLSTALISDHYFLTKPEPPEIPFDDLSVDKIILSKQEYQVIKNDVTKLIVDIASQNLPQLGFLKQSVPENVAGANSNQFAKKTKIIPLPCLPYNEQYYQDDVLILQWYQKLCQQIIAESGLDPNTKFQIGGDQLTRERLTGAMLLRLGNLNPADRFSNIGRCTFEFFHLGMNYLEKAIFAELWNEKGVVEMGTVRGECERISRHTVDPDIMKAYDADKRFIFEYLNAVAVEAIMDYFNMNDVNDAPSRNVPPSFNSLEEQKNWVYEHFGKIVDMYIYPVWSGNTTQQTLDDGDENDMQHHVEVCLGHGQVLRIPIDITQRTQPKPDKIKDYAHISLEVGFTFKYFLELVKTPDRDKFLGLLKMMMIQLKGHSINAKYPKEILRMLVQQYSVIGFREACQIFQACFVNLHGKHDTHVPADLIQEWNVKESKSHIKHMFSNKSEQNIISRTSALPGIHEIASNFDHEAGTIIRAKRHNESKIDEKDQQILMDDMRSIKPFTLTEGRAYSAFKTIPKSLALKVEGYNVHKWINKNKRSFFI